MSRRRLQRCAGRCLERLASINYFNGGHRENGTRWPSEVERSLEDYVRGGGGLVVFHAANNAFLHWPAYNEMIGLGWRDKIFGQGIAIGDDGKVFSMDPAPGMLNELRVKAREHPVPVVADEGARPHSPGAASKQ